MQHDTQRLPLSTATKHRQAYNRHLTWHGSMHPGDGIVGITTQYLLDTETWSPCRLTMSSGDMRGSLTMLKAAHVNSRAQLFATSTTVRPSMLTHSR